MSADRAALAAPVVLGMGPCTRQPLVVRRLVTGKETNSHLLCDPATRQAALIDVGGDIGQLLAAVRAERLDVRYFLFTHGHPDHIAGLPALRCEFPRALVCMHRVDFENLAPLSESMPGWVRSRQGPEVLAALLADPEARKLLEFDAATFAVPDVYLTEGQQLPLGKHVITVLHSPGHSPGSVCFSVKGLLFSGDVLFRDSVGRVDVLYSSREDQIRSVRRLYDSLSEETTVYPGHGESTTIGREKRENRKITAETVNL